MRKVSFGAAIAIAVISTATAFAGTVNEYQKLIAHDGGSDALFGSSVAVDAQTSVIGAPADPSAAVPGAVYTFKRNPDRTWAKELKLMAADGAEGDEFGAAVAVEADTLIVGAPMADEASGAAYVFERRAGNWVERQKLATDAESATFGQSIALEFDTALVGAPGEHGQTGAVYVFQRNGNGTWDRVQKIPGPAFRGATGAAGLFGTSVALSRDLALIGNPAEDGTGAAYLVERGADGSWGELRRLTADDGEIGDGFGVAVALDGYRAIIGADRANAAAGSAYVFEPVAGGAWELKQKLVVANPASIASFGRSVALHRDTAVVGGNGSAHTFTRNPHTRVWAEREELRSSEGSVGFFGHAVGWDGTTAVVGASLDDQNGSRSGSSYVFRLSPVVNAIFPFAIHPRNRGIVQIAILGSEELDVTRIDMTTLRFGPDEVAPVHDLTDSFAMTNHLREVNGDGIIDLVLHFRTRRSGIGCGDEIATLTGQTLDGRMIDVSGSIQAIGCQSSPASRDRGARPGR